MFVSQAVWFIVYLAMRFMRRAPNIKPRELAAPSGRIPPCLKTRLLLIIPGIINLVGSALGLVGLVTTAASVYQMLKAGTLVIWSFVLSIIFLHAHYTVQRYVGIFTIVVGLILVSLASVLWSSVTIF